jgi:hypothetical protein
MFDVWDWRNLSGEVTRCPALNAASGNRINVTTSGLLTTSRLWGMTATGNMVLGSGSIAIEKSVFDGSKAYAIEAVLGVSTGLTFRNVAFTGFSSYGVRVSGVPLPGLIDYCGRSNGCAAFSNSAGSEGAHNVTTDPLFTDYAGHDYTIPSNSPYRDAGTACVATVDPIGTVIPQGVAPDIGAYELFIPVIVKLTGATATGFDEVTITADGDLTDAISSIGDWAVTADNLGIADPVISSITIGAPTNTAVIAFTADLTPREYYTITTTSTDVEAGFRTLQFQTPADGARLVSAMFVPTINAIAVAADLPLTTASNGTSKWSISVVDGFGDQLTLTQAQIQGTGSQVIGLTYDGTPTPGAKYIITTTSTDFETGYTTGYAVVALDDQDFTPEPLLPTMLSAIGKQIAVDTGFPQTVLTAFLTPGDTTAYVESTLNFPNTDGILYINGVRIDYTTKTANTFEGLIWETTSDGVNNYYLNTEVILDGSPVMDYSQTYSLQDKATNENIVNRSFGKELKRLAKSLGFPVPLASMTDTDIQEYLNERMYQPTGIPSAIFRTLRPVLRALELTGTATVSDAVTITGVIMNNPLQVMQMLGRWVEINGRIAKIFNATLTAPDTYTWEFVAYDGYCWQHPTLTEVGVGNSVAWRLIPYLFNDVVTETITNLGPFVGNVNFDRAAQFDLHLFVGNQMPAGYPTGYWLEDHTVDMPGGGLAPTDGRSIHNYLADTHLTEATADDRFLYLLDDYDYEIAELLSDLLPAGVIGNVIVYLT